MTPAEFPWERRLGATPVDDGVEFRVWAPRADSVAVRVSRRGEHALEHVGHGVYEGVVDQARPGDDYRFVLDGRRRLPDPCSRHQPKGLRGPSRVVDARAFEWGDAGWRGVPLAELVIYELHVGTFTEEGTFDAVVPHLRALRELGVTAIELMPVADFPGDRGWGYDGVYISAAHEAYGGPHGLQRLVDAAHREGIAVLLDVVYNHLGASGVKAIDAFGPYFTDTYETFWGKALNYDDARSDAVREWAVQSACGWVQDFHLDGLRLDAVHSIFDQSATHVMAQLAERVHAVKPSAVVIAESSLNDARVIRPRELGGWGHDAQWADDFHHSLRVLLTGEQEGYYADFGRVADLAKAYARPFVYDGGYSPSRLRRHGAPADDRPPEQFVVCSQNHDQVGNRAFGDRLPSDVQPLAALCTLTSPFTPMLFMGEEYGEQAPFQFFTDHIDKRIIEATREGRRREFAEFAEFAGEQVPDPQALETFERSRLTREETPGMRELYTRLIGLRRELGGAEAEVEFDEDGRWLVARRGEHLICANFAAQPAELPAGAAGEVVIATHEASLAGGRVRLPALAGAVVR